MLCLTCQLGDSLDKLEIQSLSAKKLMTILPAYKTCNESFLIHEKFASCLRLY